MVSSFSVRDIITYDVRNRYTAAVLREDTGVRKNQIISDICRGCSTCPVSVLDILNGCLVSLWFEVLGCADDARLLDKDAIRLYPTGVLLNGSKDILKDEDIVQVASEISIIADLNPPNVFLELVKSLRKTQVYYLLSYCVRITNVCILCGSRL